MSVVVVGSFIIDLVATTKRAPERGETVVGLSFNTYFGGKGANQAFASIRMNSKTTMIGSVGRDKYGDEFLQLLQDEGFNTDYIYRSKDNSTGVSLVTVETNGQNRICMVPGANLDFNELQLDELVDIIKEANVCVTQCEMQYSIVQKLARICGENNVKFILNPAPARKIDDDVLKNTFIITPNETELDILVGKECKTLEDYILGAKELINKGVKNVVVTLGEVGSLLVNNTSIDLIKAFKVQAVDTVGAGDSFTGSLAAFIDQGYDLKQALIMASATSALEVQKKGAIPSIPTRNEVDEFLQNKQI